ncbi:MAG: hypothetical protein J6M90_03005 [Oscillospiraceae bacterium]|nr:hypothetical protein [Oscillospiraceae bacterium]
MKTMIIKKAAIAAIALLSAATISTSVGAVRRTPDESHLWFNTMTGEYYSSYNEAFEAGFVGDVYKVELPQSIDCSATLSSTYRWRNYDTGKFYKTYDDAYKAKASNHIVDEWSAACNDYSAKATTAYCWYSAATGRYYKSRDNAVIATMAVGMDVSNVWRVEVKTPAKKVASSTKLSANYRWYSYVTGLYYRTQADALSVSYNNSSNIEYAWVECKDAPTTDFAWYNLRTDKYYKTEDAAINADRNGVVYCAISGRCTESFPWYNTYTDMYYATEADAERADSWGYVYYAFN